MPGVESAYCHTVRRFAATKGTLFNIPWLVHAMTRPRQGQFESVHTSALPLALAVDIASAMPPFPRSPLQIELATLCEVALPPPVATAVELAIAAQTPRGEASAWCNSRPAEMTTAQQSGGKGLDLTPGAHDVSAREGKGVR